MSLKYVYQFSEADGSMRELLGGKGANLAEMTKLGLPVPKGFTVSTAACNLYYDQGETLTDEIVAEILDNIKKLEDFTGKGFGDLNNPLLVSVRSGARASMPGMMDTVLNLGLNDEVVESLAKLTNNPRFAYDSYRRFIQMFADVVMEVPKHEFEVIIDEMKNERGIKLDNEFSAEDLKEMVTKFKAYYQSKRNELFPNDPKEQLIAAVKAVFRSWNNERAIYYRRVNDIPASWGTAVNVQEMVFGNMGDDCATGVAFTRNPATGEKKVFGEFLINAQGEDVVAGIRTPMYMDEMEKVMPDVYKQFMDICETLENHYHDMQDMEFTVEKGKLFMLQTRNGKRTAKAALKIAVDLVNEGLINEKEAVLQIDPKLLDSLLHPQFDADDIKKHAVIGKGLAASPGAAAGHIVLDAATAKEWANDGKKVVLVRLETSPEDIEGMNVSEGVLTARGGMTSHAAVVARGMGICAVSGSNDLKIVDENTVTIGGKEYHQGDFISLDGSTGTIYEGLIKTVPASISGDFKTFMEWVDRYRLMRVHTNADTPKDAKQALDFGAEGIGLVRTEHMFFEASRIRVMREMILSRNLEQREHHLARLEVFQQQDFEGIYEVMKELPVTIRYLDPPLHEFLPQDPEEIKSIAKEMGVELDYLNSVIASLHEFNPMMGHRGCRLAVSYPEIARMQTRAVINAAINTNKKLGINLVPEIMIPLVGDVKELEFIKSVVDKEAKLIIEASGQELKYKVGTMIEVVRAALVADEIAKVADFFSFGSNDLTQYTFGFSRDDAAKFLDDYYSKKIYEQDPFQRMDEKGVGQLVQMAVDKGRSSKPELKCGICGEHGGDPATINFLYNLGLTYVSCSPFRVPIARLAAAQASIRNPR